MKDKRDLRERIQRAKEKSQRHSFGEDNERYEDTEQESTGQFVDQGESQGSIAKDKYLFPGKQLTGMKRLGYMAIAIGVAAVLFTNTSTVDTSESARNALENQISTSISAGVVLLKDDESLQPQDYTITHSSNAEETKIWIWDYAAEDGDYVQVLVNGTPISDPFMIQHKPKEFLVPATGSIQIKGIRDGGGGITYAVRYDINGTSYFNTAPEGEFNTYELVR